MFSSLPFKQVPELARVEYFEPANAAQSARDIIAAGTRGAEEDLSGSVWGIHMHKTQMPLIRVVESGDEARLIEVLSDIHNRLFTLGYDQHARITRKLREDAGARAYMANRMAHALHATGFALGLVPMWNEEQKEGSYPYLETDQCDALAGAILDALGYPGRVPVSGPDTFGIATGRGVLNHRQLLAIGYLREIRTALAGAGRRYERIVEIGGGLGRIAALASRALDLPYAIIDLPAVAITQYWYLRSNDIEARLFADAPGDAGVSLINAFDPLPAQAYRNSLFVNFDGLVEMNRDTQERYFDLIARSGSDLLSVNHEANKTMTHDGQSQNCDIARICALGMGAGPRQLFWERQGYVSQFFAAARVAG